MTGTGGLNLCPCMIFDRSRGIARSRSEGATENYRNSRTDHRTGPSEWASDAVPGGSGSNYILICGNSENMGQRVRDIMTTDLVTLSPDNTIRDATIRLAVENISGAPVVDENYRMVGILSGNDILNLIVDYDRKKGNGLIDNMLSFYMDDNVEDPELKKMVDEISNTKVSDIMTRTVLSTSPDAKIIDLLRSMINMNISRVPVLEKGVLIGIVSRADIIFSIYKKKI